MQRRINNRYVFANDFSVRGLLYVLDMIIYVYYIYLQTVKSVCVRVYWRIVYSVYLHPNERCAYLLVMLFCILLYAYEWYRNQHENVVTYSIITHVCITYMSMYSWMPLSPKTIVSRWQPNVITDSSGLTYSTTCAYLYVYINMIQERGHTGHGSRTCINRWRRGGVYPLNIYV